MIAKTYNKICKIVEKNRYICLLIFGLAVCAANSFYVKLIDNDEIYTFANIYKIYNGGKMYIDNNVIQTPLFFYLGLIILKLFGANIFAYKIYNIILSLLLFGLIFILFECLEIDFKKSWLASVIIFLYYSKVIRGGASYNTLALDFFVLRSYF